MVKTTNKHIGHYIGHYVHVPGDCAGSSSTWWAGTALTGRCASAGGGVPSCPYMSQLATATWGRRRFETAWACWDMRFSLALRKLRNGFIWNLLFVGECFIDQKGGEHLSEGPYPPLWLDSIWHSRVPGLVFRLNLRHQRSSLPSFICVLLSQTKVDTAVMITSFLVIIRLSLLWLPLLCVAVRAPLWSFLNKFPVVPVPRMCARSPSSS